MKHIVAWQLPIHKMAVLPLLHMIGHPWVETMGYLMTSRVIHFQVGTKALMVTHALAYLPTAVVMD